EVPGVELADGRPETGTLRRPREALVPAAAARPVLVLLAPLVVPDVRVHAGTLPHKEDIFCHLYGMRATRLVSLLLLLQTRGQLTAAEVAGTLDVSVRTVHRDVESLVAAGVPVEAVRGPAGRYRLSAARPTPPHRPD